MQGIFRRRRLPHWDVVDGTYFVTTCLEGSIPANGLRELMRYREQLGSRECPPAMISPEWEHHKSKLAFAQLDKWLDGKPAVRHLEQVELVQIVQRAIYHFAGTRYDLMAYVIMPSHVHWLFHPLLEWCHEISRGAGFQPVNPIDSQDGCPTEEMTGKTPAPRRSPRETIMHSLKSYTANECNKLLGRTGPFWQDESYDHWVRDEEELLRIIAYIEQNPVKAGLVSSAAEYRFSSAYDRMAKGVLPGEALVA